MRDITGRIIASILILLNLTNCLVNHIPKVDYNSEIARLESEILELQEQRTSIIQDQEIENLIATEYKPYTDFYLEYSYFSDIEKSSDPVQQKVLEYNAWFLEKQKLFVLGELSGQEEKILEKIELIKNNPN